MSDELKKNLDEVKNLTADPAKIKSYVETVGLRLQQTKDGLQLQRLQLISAPDSFITKWAWLDVPIVNAEEEVVGWAFSQEMLQRFS